jgi:trans-2-enoyl-CoA reductase
MSSPAASSIMQCNSTVLLAYTHTANMGQKVLLKAPNMEDPASGLEVCSIEDSSPQLEDGQVLVGLSLRPINPADIFSIMGVYPGFNAGAPGAVPGLEGVGVVLESASKNVPKGAKVIGRPFTSVEGGQGTWQSQVVASEDDVFVIPTEAGLDDTSLAQFYVNPVTAYGMLADLDIPAGAYLLQTGAGSVLGRQVIQMCNAKGIRTINVVRREALVEELKALDADAEVIVAESADAIIEQVSKITDGKGAYGAIECVGGEVCKGVVSSVRNNGVVFLYGAMGGLEITCGIPDILFRGVQVKGWWLVNYMGGKTVAETAAVCQEILKLMTDKVVTPYSGTVFGLSEVRAAVAEATKAARGGKVFLSS